MTLRGTRHLKNLTYLPCSCPVCRKYDALELKNMIKGERIRLLAEHNLHVSMSEVQTIRQAISEGTLWELMENRSRGHSALAAALNHLNKYRDELEKGSPMYKGRGIFIFDRASLARPEISRFVNKIDRNTRRNADKLVLLPKPSRKPFNQSNEYIQIKDKLNEISSLQICFYVQPFGIVPVELSETYPSSQFNLVEPTSYEIQNFTVNNIKKYLKKSNYKKIIVLSGNRKIDLKLIEELEKMYSQNKEKLTIIKVQKPWSQEALNEILLNIN